MARYDGMARLPRVRLPDVPLHVVVRGNNRQPIFVSDGDRIVFHRTLADAAGRFGVEIHAYVFMPNHVHLLVTGRSAESVSKALQSVGRRYVGYFNFMHRRTGTLWEGRYYSSVIDADRYFLACQRYIEMNPVRAALCRDPMQYLWSSHRYYAANTADDLLTPHSIHAQFERGEAYRNMFADELSIETLQAIRDCVRHGWVLGDDRFRERIAEASQRRPARLTPIGRPKKPELTEKESDPI